MAQTINRKSAVKQGFYDGRFRTKVVSDKKKNAYLKMRRNKKIFI